MFKENQLSSNDLQALISIVVIGVGHRSKECRSKDKNNCI